MSCHVHYRNQCFEVPEGQSVLTALEAQGQSMVSSCRAGVCQTCKKKAASGQVPEAAQKGLKPTEQALHYFLPCICYPHEDLMMEDIEQASKYKATILSIQKLNDDIAEIQLACSEPFDYQPGQYLNLYKDDSQCRTYSLASLPAYQEALTLHVKKMPNGLVSTWLHEQAKPGMSLEISGPLGDCFYHAQGQSHPLILLGTSSGLAPLYGIVREALRQQHALPIWLFHGVNTKSQLYHQHELRELMQQYPHFHYLPCLAEEEQEGYALGLVTDIALQQPLDFKNSLVYLAGSPVMIKQASMKMFLAGVSLERIYKDPFDR